MRLGEYYKFNLNYPRGECPIFALLKQLELNQLAPVYPVTSTCHENVEVAAGAFVSKRLDKRFVVGFSPTTRDK